MSLLTQFNKLRLTKKKKNTLEEKIKIGSEFIHHNTNNNLISNHNNNNHINNNHINNNNNINIKGKKIKKLNLLGLKNFKK